jgi:hypothetical protein
MRPASVTELRLHRSHRPIAIAIAFTTPCLGVARDPVKTTTDFGAVARFGVQSAGGANAATAPVVAEQADVVERGELEVPFAIFALDDVHDAFRQLEAWPARQNCVAPMAPKFSRPGRRRGRGRSLP